MPAKQSTLRIAIDTGGTFTDCVWVENGEIRALKVFSTPDNPSRAIADALTRIEAGAGITLLHGTTVGTNALLQRKGARIALITTAGFEDVIEIGRQARPRLYDFFFDRVPPLVARELRFGIKERTAADGEILERPSEEALAGLITALEQTDPEALAISFLFSFANPANEIAVARVLEKLNKPLSISHQILPEFREYERTSTVVVNAYLQPLMQTYLEELGQRASEFSAHKRPTEKSSARKTPASRIFVMQSSGGITALESAAREPVRTVLSGPAGGLVGAAASAKQSGFEQIISFDMGGTSTDVALVQGEVAPSSQSEVAGFPVGVPMLDIHTVGAGGGSLARFDAAGALRVGPESAGADPGPICYGRGTQPTVTDANLLLGRLRPDRFLGGEFTLDLERTRRIVSEWLKKQGSKLNLEQFSAGIVRVVNANMERALRVVSIERGYDPREFALVAFGGAGGLHACELAEALAIPTVLLPARPGALSAFGILVSDVIKDFSRTELWPLDGKVPRSKLETEFRKLEQAAGGEFRNEGWNGQPHFERSLDLRYRGQGYELNVPADGDVVQHFHEEHQRRYRYHHPRKELELVTIRLRARIKTRAPVATKSPDLGLGNGSRRKSATTSYTGEHRGKIRAHTLSRSVRSANSISAERSPVFFNGKTIATAICDRKDIAPAQHFSGPAIITEYSATTVVPPGKEFWVDQAENLLISIR